MKFQAFNNLPEQWLPFRFPIRNLLPRVTKTPKPTRGWLQEPLESVIELFEKDIFVWTSRTVYDFYMCGLRTLYDKIMTALLKSHTDHQIVNCKVCCLLYSNRVAYLCHALMALSAKITFLTLYDKLVKMVVPGGSRR